MFKEGLLKLRKKCILPHNYYINRLSPQEWTQPTLPKLSLIPSTVKAMNIYHFDFELFIFKTLNQIFYYFF